VRQTILRVRRRHLAGNRQSGAGKRQKRRGGGSLWEKAAQLQPDDITLARQVAQLLLQAGFPERAGTFFSKLADQKDPQRRLDALYDLARIFEFGDQFVKADKALRDGLALLHFRDGRYLDFFRRRVRLHERFGTLEEMKTALVQAAKAEPPSEQALLDVTRFFEITVELDEHVKWLRELVKAVPQVEDYRWELVRALLDHEGASEAAQLLDERLKNDGSDLPGIVLLRCEADLRAADSEAAVKRLTKLLAAQPGIEVEKQVLAFAQTRALDAVIVQILSAPAWIASRRRPRRSSSWPATTVRTAICRRKTGCCANSRLPRRRRTSVGSGWVMRRAFLAASSNLDSAIILARESVAKPGAGRDDWLRLADLLAEQGDSEEAASGSKRHGRRAPRTRSASMRMSVCFRS
jgi:tetratricopeptide (TPR) repeat protein